MPTTTKRCGQHVEGEQCDEFAHHEIRDYFPPKYDRPSRPLYLCDECADIYESTHPFDKGVVSPIDEVA